MFKFWMSIAMQAAPSPLAEKKGTAAGRVCPEDDVLKSLNEVGSWAVEMSTCAEFTKESEAA